MPRCCLDQLSATAPWPPVEGDEPLPSQAVQQRWEEARRQLLFKPVSSLSELVAFFFPGLAAAALRQEQEEAGDKKRARRASGGKKHKPPPPPEVDVGPVSTMRVPLWGQGLEGRVTVVEACLVKGAEKTVRAGAEGCAGGGGGV